MRCELKLNGVTSFEASTDSGHTFTLDGSPELGGENKGPRPMELMLLAVGSCGAMDVLSMLKKARQQVTDVQIELEAPRVDSIPQVFSHVHIHYKIYGHDLSADKIARALELSATKYCSASVMMSAHCDVTHDFEIIEG